MILLDSPRRGMGEVFDWLAPHHGVGKDIWLASSTVVNFMNANINSNFELEAVVIYLSTERTPTTLSRPPWIFCLHMPLTSIMHGEYNHNDNYSNEGVWKCYIFPNSLVSIRQQRRLVTSFPHFEGTFNNVSRPINEEVVVILEFNMKITKFRWSEILNIVMYLPVAIMVFAQFPPHTAFASPLHFIVHWSLLPCLP